MLVGDRVRVETPHPRGAATGVAGRLDGRVLEAAEARGKNLLLRFDGGRTLRTHLRMSGRWRVLRTDQAVRGRPLLVLRGSDHTGVLFGGAVLELTDRRVRRLGPDILADPPDLAGMLANLRAADQGRQVGEALLDQRLVAGIGNLWRAEALWRGRLSPWPALREVGDEELRAALAEAASLMRASLAGRRPARAVYRRAGKPCLRCGTAIRSGGQGDDNRIAYWCPGCQDAGGRAAGA